MFRVFCRRYWFYFEYQFCIYVRFLFAVNGEDGKFQGCVVSESSNNSSCVEHFQQQFSIPENVKMRCKVCKEDLCNNGERNVFGRRLYLLFLIPIFIKQFWLYLVCVFFSTSLPQLLQILLLIFVLNCNFSNFTDQQSEFFVPHLKYYKSPLIIVKD